jgi:hypothetical protein
MKLANRSLLDVSPTIADNLLLKGRTSFSHPLNAPSKNGTFFSNIPGKCQVTDIHGVIDNGSYFTRISKS